MERGRLTVKIFFLGTQKWIMLEMQNLPITFQNFADHLDKV